MEQLFDRTAIRGLFEELAIRLQRRGVRANIYVFGGAAMAMLFDDRRVTRDIDGVILHGHGPLTEEVRDIARERGLPTKWMNEQAATYVARSTDQRQSIVFDHPSLTVAAASVEHLLAMKLIAARASDAADIARLVRHMGVADVATAEQVLHTVFPDKVLTDRARLLLEDVLASQVSPPPTDGE